MQDNFTWYIRFYEINVELYENNDVHKIAVTKRNGKRVVWVRMTVTQKKIGVTSMSDLTIKEIKCIFNTRNITKEQKAVYKRFGSEWIKDENYMYIRNDLISLIIMNCRTPKAVAFKSN